ncbi:MAG TPA: vWA domain-containing protein [Nocardioides sp.]|nr:vWA domain-containing protein [Nocardioides sp.]
MTDPNLTHIYLLLDRSGSMQSIKTDTEGGFAAFVEEQKRTPGECRVTLAQFDNHYDVVYTDRPIADVPALDLQPRGSTALLDAMGRSITDAGTKLAALSEDQRPDTVIVAIMTDGHENASQEWTHPAIKALVEQQTEQYGWQFLYMGADQDAIEVGRNIGIKADHSVTYGRGKSQDVMTSASAKIAEYRTARAAGDLAAPMPAFTDEERRDLS